MYCIAWFVSLYWLMPTSKFENVLPVGRSFKDDIFSNYNYNIHIINNSPVKSKSKYTLYTLWHIVGVYAWFLWIYSSALQALRYILILSSGMSDMKIS